MTKAFEEIKEGMLQAIAHAQGKPVPGTKVHAPELEDWQIEEIKQGLKEADAGDFESEEEFAKIVNRYSNPR
jgi:predicted transcriptional regulator